MDPINAIRGVADGNSMRQHIANFIDAIGSRLIPYTPSEKKAMGTAVDVMDKYKDLFDGT